MKKIISYYTVRTLVLFLLLFSSISGYASHIVGMDLFYTHISDSTYKITVVAFGDCGPASAGAFADLPISSPTICIYDGGTYVTSISLTIQPPTAGVEITPVCAGTITQCSSLASPVPGIKKFVYTHNYTLPHKSHLWRFRFTGDMGFGAASAGRAAAITNILGGTTTQLVDTLDNTYHNNSNPVLTVVPTPFFCLNNSDSYTPGAIDADGDLLNFALVPGMNGSTTCMGAGSPVTYTGTAWPGQPITATTPLKVAMGTFALDPLTGLISFFPNAIQRALVVYNIREFRNDTFIGSCQREMTFLVQTCTDPPPIGGIVAASSGTVVDSTHFNICSGTGAFVVTIHPSETDTNNVIKCDPSGIPAGATFTTANDSTNHPTCTFSWSTTGLIPGSYIFYVTYKDDNCPLPGVQTIPYTINILPRPTMTATGGGTFCQGTAASLSVSGSGAATYVWSPGTGLSCTSCSSPSSTPPLGTTVYTISAVDTNSCMNTDTISVTVVAIPTLTVTPPTTICKYTSTTLAVSGALTYLWSPGTGLSCTTCSSPVASPTVSVTYTVTGSGPNGCSSSETVTLTIQAPIADAGPSTIICAGGSTTLSPGGGVSYTWSPGSGLSCTACPNPIATPTATTVYTVTVTDASGCFDFDTVHVVYVPEITVAAPAIAICTSIPGTVTASGATSYVWSPAVGLSCTNCSNPSANPPLTTTYTVIGTTSVCHDTSTVTVTVNPLPVITSSGTATKCLGDSAPIFGYGGTSYSWSPITGLSCTSCFDPMATPSATTTYVVTGYNTFGCHSQSSVTITVQPIPELTITPPLSICNGTTATLTVSGALSYVWTPGAGLTPDTGATVTAAPLATIVYSVTGTGPNNCTSTTSTTVTVYPIPPVPNVVTPVNYCKDAPSIQLIAYGSDLLWYTVATGGLGDPAAPVPTTTSTGTTTWFVSQTVNGCESPRNSIDVTIFDNAITGFEYDIKYGCYMDTVTFINTSQYTTKSIWSMGDGSVDTNTNPIHYYPVVKDTAYLPIELIGFNPACYSDSTLKTMPLAPTPQKHFLYDVSPDAVINYGSSVQLNSQGAYIYMWVPDNGSLSNPNINNPVATPLEDTTYIVYGYDINGCMDSARVRVDLVHDEESIPSAFTPNDDGLNDIFRVHNLKFGHIVEFNIYNRWGQLIFHALDNKGWDGTFNRVKQDMGVYNYLIIVSHSDGQNKLWKGDVTLLR